MVKCDKYVVGGEKNRVYEILAPSPTDAYMEMRFKGEIVDVCTDIFFLTHDDENLLSHIWMCYGKHENSVSNWGAVFTPEEFRGKGYCAKTLEYCFKEIDALENGPTALLCTAGSDRLAKLYAKYGFVPALRSASCGPLYRPVGNNSKNFQDFCKNYYTETDKLFAVKADFGWRNEIDCLLKFALLDIGELISIKGFNNLATLLLKEPERTKVILTKDNKCVGWMVDNEVQLPPLYRDIKNIIFR